MFRLKNILIFLCVSFIFLQQAHTVNPSLDTLDFWVKVNDGFSKCPLIGGYAGEAQWNVDDFEVKTLLHRRGLAYAWIGYGNDYDNKASCPEALYYHDTIINKWIKVAEMPSYLYSIDELYTNGNDIFAFAHTAKYTEGLILQYTNNYLLYPTGWKELSVGMHRTIGNNDVFPSAEIIARGGDPADESVWMESHSHPRVAIGDTIFVWFQSRAVDGWQKIGKFSVKDGYWRFEDIPPPPRGATVQNGGPHLVITDYIGGYFRYFLGYRDPYKKLDIGGPEGFMCGMSTDFPYAALPQAIWVYDPRNKQWRDISRGPNWCNLTPSGATANGGMYSSWDNKRMVMVNQQGTWEWQGDRWDYLNDRIKGIAVVTSNGLFYYGATHSGSLGGGGGYSERFLNANFMIIGPLNDPNCVCNEGNYCTNYEAWMSPDDGRTIYSKQQSRDPIYCEGLGASDNEWKDVGIYRLMIDNEKEESIRNLHVEAATYLGGPSGNNKPVNVGVGDRFKLYVAGNFPSVQAQRPGHPAWTTTSINGANNSSPGKIIVLNRWADTILKVINVGTLINTYEMQNWGAFRMVVAGDWGVSVLDSSAALLWTVPIAQLGGTGTLRADIDDLGNVAVLNITQKKWYVISPAGIIKTPGGNTTNAPSSVGPYGDVYNTQSDYPQDIAILNDTVFVVGFNNDVLNNPAVPICGENSGLAVQSNFLRCWKNDGTNNYIWLWRTYDMKGGYLGLDQADSRLYRINIGKNGKLYALGEQANSNGVFRWNGKTSVELEAMKHGGVCDQNTNHGTFTTVITDRYDALWGFCSAVHIGFYCEINPADGVVQRGQFLSTIKSDGCKNSFRTSNGYIHADAKGYIYVMGSSAARYPNREVQYINGQLIGEYAGGDPTITIVRPDMTVRTFYGAFPDTVASGTLCGVGIRDNWIAMVGYNPIGKLITGATRITDPVYHKTYFKKEWAINPEPFNLGYKSGSTCVFGNCTNNDAYLAVWYQDVWNHSQDTLDPNPIPGDIIICDSAFFCKADFKVKEIPLPDLLWDHKQYDISVCTDQDITFSDMSVCAVDWQWDFGQGANLLPGTTGKGPWTVRYSSPGLKTVNLWATINSKGVSCNDTLITDREEKPGYVNVIPANLTLGSISGPVSVCAGTEAVFEVASVYGIQQYHWTVPAGSVILDGANSNKIRVNIGNVSGIVRVFADHPCGSTPVESLNITVNMAIPNQVLFAVGNDVLNTGDAALKSRIENLGYSVWVRDDDDLVKEDAGCASLAVISSSVNENSVKTKLREAAIPVICFKPELFDDMSYTYGILNSDYGISSPRNRIEISDSSHELAGHLAEAPVNVYSSPVHKVNWGYPSSSAYMIATVDANDAHISIFGYERGAMMKNNFIAPARRVGFFLDHSGVTGLTAQGDTLLAYALCWSVSRCPLPGSSLQLSGVSETQVCPGQAISVNYTVTGDFGRKEIAPSVPTVIVDNNDSRCYLYGDYHHWSGRTTPGGYFGSNFVINTASAATRRSNERAVFIPVITYSGYYTISINYPNNPTACTAVPVDIVDSDSNTTRIIVNMTSGGSWKNLGVYYLQSGTNNKVVVWSSTGLSGDIIWDAVKFEPQGIDPILLYNNFTVQLSNQYGSFAGNPLVIGEKADSVSGTIHCTLPVDLQPGTNYKVRILSSSPSLVSQSFVSSLSVRGYPQNAGPVYGEASPCIGDIIQVYSVDSVPGAWYEWEASLGATILDPVPPDYRKPFFVRTQRSTIRVNLGTATINNLKVWLINDCGKSIDPSILTIRMNSTIPDKPGTIGPLEYQKMCTNGEYEFSVTLANGAQSYEWSIPSWCVVTGPYDTTNRIRIRAQGVHGSSGTLRVRAHNHCGVSEWSMLAVEVDNISTVPQLQNLSGGEIFCKGESDIYKLTPPVNNATYNWTIPPGAILVQNTIPNIAEVRFPVNMTGQLRLTVTNACGTSAPKVKNITVGSGGGRRMLLVVGNPASLTGNDAWMKSRLETTHAITVHVYDDDSAAPSDVNCHDFVIISTTCNSGVGAKYMHAETPVIVNNTGAMISIGMANESGTRNDNQMIVVTNSHDVTRGLTNGATYKVYDISDATQALFGGAGTYNQQPCSEQNYIGARCFARCEERDFTLLSYERGNLMGKNGGLGPAPDKRMAFFLADNAVPLTSIGIQLFDQAICWTTNSCGLPVIDTYLSGVEFCKGDSVNIVFGVSKNFNPGNIFTVQLSNSAGSFASPTVLGTKNAVSDGNIKVKLPDALPDGTAYRIRVTGSNPVVDGNNNGTNLRIRYCTVCPDSIITGRLIQNVTCNNASDGAITITAGNGTTPYTYLWNNGHTSRQLTGVIAGLYYVTVADRNNCTDTRSYIITQPSPITIYNAIPASVTDCSHADGTITVYAGGGTGSYQYSLNNLTWQNSNTFSNLASGHYYISIRNGSGGCVSDSVISVVVNSPPVPVINSIQKFNPSDCGLSDGSIVLSVSVPGSSANYSIDSLIWTATPVINGLAPGPYTVFVRNAAAHHCTVKSQPQILSANDVPVIDSVITQLPSDCGTDDAGLRVVATGIAPLQYSLDSFNWVGSPSFNGLIANQSHTVYVRPQSLTRCVAEQTVFIPGLHPPVIDSIVSVNPATCESNDGSIRIFASPTSATFDYSINGAVTWQSNRLFSNLASGNYAVSVRNSNGTCTISGQTITLTAPLAPMIDGTNTTAVTRCDVPDGKITIHARPAGNSYQYLVYNSTYNLLRQWSNDSIYSGLAPGAYYLAIRNSDQTCRVNHSSPVMVNDSTPKFAIITGSPMICLNDSVTLTAPSGKSYRWNTSPADTLNNIRISPASTTIYTVTVTTHSGCITTGNKLVIVNDLPLVVFQPAQIELCNPTVLLRPVSDPSHVSFLWDNGITSASRTVAQTGTYSIVVTDNKNCSQQASVEVISPANPLSLLLEPHREECPGDNNGILYCRVTGGTPGYTFVLNTGESITGSFAEFVDLSPGSYSVTITDSIGCSAADAAIIDKSVSGIEIISINSKNPFCELSSDGSITINVNDGLFYQWDNSKSGKTINGLSQGTYRFTVTDQFGCSVSEAVVLTPRVENCVTIPTAFSPNGDGINDVWEIAGLYIFYPNCKIEVFSRWGEKLFSSKGYNHYWDGTLNGRPLAIDSYHFIINFGDGSKPKTGQVLIIR